MTTTSKAISLKMLSKTLMGLLNPSIRLGVIHHNLYFDLEAAITECVKELPPSSQKDLLEKFIREVKSNTAHFLVDSSHKSHPTPLIKTNYENSIIPLEVICSLL